MIEAIIMMLVLGAALGLGLGLASEKLHVEVDPAFDDVLTMLPGLNCGACGYPGCAGLAEALVDHVTENVGLCRPANKNERERIAEYLQTYFDNNGVKANIRT
ncbi:MAG: electron transporter RnfB [Erysipelothrix sp.]|nr:electron transporter RnfB [Erysipelothrix sp.]